MIKQSSSEIWIPFGCQWLPKVACFTKNKSCRGVRNSSLRCWFRYIRTPSFIFNVKYTLDYHSEINKINRKNAISRLKISLFGTAWRLWVRHTCHDSCPKWTPPLCESERKILVVSAILIWLVMIIKSFSGSIGQADIDKCRTVVMPLVSGLFSNPACFCCKCVQCKWSTELTLIKVYRYLMSVWCTINSSILNVKGIVISSRNQVIEQYPYFPLYDHQLVKLEAY